VRSQAAFADRRAVLGVLRVALLFHLFPQVNPRLLCDEWQGWLDSYLNGKFRQPVKQE
jgi:hypothetical protein